MTVVIFLALDIGLNSFIYSYKIFHCIYTWADALFLYISLCMRNWIISFHLWDWRCLTGKDLCCAYTWFTFDTIFSEAISIIVPCKQNSSDLDLTVILGTGQCLLWMDVFNYHGQFNDLLQMISFFFFPLFKWIPH